VALTARLAAMIAGDDRPTSEAWLDLAERAFVDTVGVLFAGRREPAVTALADTVLAEESGGPARSVAVGRAVPVGAAALLDATAAHALDYDDVDDAMLGHPSAVLVPTVLALAGAAGASGDEMLEAYQRGLETARALAGALGIEGHYEAGWHSTSTIGTLAAAAAAARLLHLTRLATRHALGMAASMASGSRQNFGTMTKPLHAGLAAERGILAARLAARGFTADADQLDGPMGFLALYGADGVATAARAGTGAVWAEEDAGEPCGLNVKLHPCCYATHAAVDAALELRPTVGDVDAVDSIDVVARPGGLAPLIHHRPVDGLQAKFSLEYTVAAALIDGAVTLASFDDGRAGLPDVQRLLERVRITAADTAPTGPSAWASPFPAVVTVNLTGGGSVTARVDHPAGHATRPVTDEQLRAKFTDCLASVGVAPVVVAEAHDTLRYLRHQPAARTVLDVLAGRP
jgi:2-methylcitrate dehydratase PrpD